MWCKPCVNEGCSEHARFFDFKNDHLVVSPSLQFSTRYTNSRTRGFVVTVVLVLVLVRVLTQAWAHAVLVVAMVLVVALVHTKVAHIFLILCASLWIFLCTAVFLSLCVHVDCCSTAKPRQLLRVCASCLAWASATVPPRETRTHRPNR